MHAGAGPALAQPGSFPLPSRGSIAAARKPAARTLSRAAVVSSMFSAQLVQQRGRLIQLVNPEDRQHKLRSRFESAVGVVNVNLLFTQPRRCAAQFAGTVRQPDYG